MSNTDNNQNPAGKSLTIEELLTLRRKEIEEKLHPEISKEVLPEDTIDEIPETKANENVSGSITADNITDDNIPEEAIEPDAPLNIPEVPERISVINEPVQRIDIPKIIETDIRLVETGIYIDTPPVTKKIVLDVPVEEPDIIIKADTTIIKEEIASAENADNSESAPLHEESKLVTDFDAHLFSKGTFYKVYDKFGAQVTTEDGLHGVRFTAWAPNAESISVIGEFNGWAEGTNVMQRVHESGLWSVFIAGLKEGDTYKFSITSKVDGVLRRKIDPYAFRSEHRPKNACVIHDINKYEWKDSEFIKTINSDPLSFKNSPINIYELHLGSWKRNYDNTEFPNEWGYLSYSQLAHEIVDYVKRLGYTHIELMPVMEHPLDISWGYQVTHYYAPTSRFGTPDDFMYFVDHCHRNNIGVILDWVPAHFPADDHALAFYDGKQIYGYESYKKGFHKDWNTYVFDYSRPQVWNFLISSALFWFEKYHIDGLRVDAVASMLYLDYSRDQGEWEPNIHGGRENLEAVEFLKHLNNTIHEYYPNALMIAEESTSWPGVSHSVAEGGLGFDMKWNMGWMNDILLYFSKDPIHRKFHQGKITFSLWYAFSENFVLPVSHDEVVHGKKSLLEKMPGDNWQKFANLRLFLGFMTGHPGKKLNFMTTDIAQYNEWNSETGLEWELIEKVELNRKLNTYTEDLNRIYKNSPALYEADFGSEGFQWIDFSDALNSVLSFYRISKDKEQILLFTFNMTPTVRDEYTFGVPKAGYWKEIFNSDAEIYGGSGIGNMGGKDSEPVKSKNWDNSIKLTLPPLAVNIFEWVPPDINAEIEPGIANVEDYYVDTDTEGGG